MPKVKVYNLQGEVVKEQELTAEFFSVPAKLAVIHQVVEAHLANQRQVLAHTKSRGEVRGGGRKPWRQKGTGRARQGSIRSPLWKGGSVIFGPTKEKNFAKDVNKKMKKLALKMVLSDKVANQRLILVEDLSLPEAKTKKLVEVLGKLPLAGKKILIALDKKNEAVVRAAKNLPQTETLPVNSLNVYDLLKFEYLLLPEKAVKKITEIYS